MTSAQTQRPLPRRQYLPHAVPSWVQDSAIFFITISCSTRGLNQLCREEIAAAIWESIEFRQQRGDWFVHFWLLMPDHLHALISFPKDRVMEKVLGNWKEITAKTCGVRWQRDFFDHRLRSNESREEKTKYILENPVRKGLTARADEWKFTWQPDRGGPSGPALPAPLSC